MKKLILVISLLAIAVGTIGWLSLRPAKPFVIHGNLSARDLVEIRRIARRELRKTILPDFSGKSLIGFPAKLWIYLGYEITEIDAFDTSGNSRNAFVIVNPSGKPNVAVNSFGYRMFKDASGWNMDVTMRFKSPHKIYHVETVRAVKMNQLSTSANESPEANPITFDQSFTDLLPGSNKNAPASLHIDSLEIESPSVSVSLKPQINATNDGVPQTRNGD